MCERKGRLVKARLGRRSKAYSQAERLARMIRALSSRSMSINDLSGEFGVSRRQIYRDIDRIQEEGHPLEQSDDGGEKSWQLPLGYKGLPPITVTPCELMALHLAKAHVAYLAGTPFVENLDGLIAKVQAGLPHRVANHLARINDVFLPRQAPVRDYSRRGDVLGKLEKALLLQRTVTLHHIRPDYEEPAEHGVDPYRLVFHQGGLYVLGLSHRAQALRLFAAERIVAIDVSDQRFEIPPDLKLEASYAHLFGLIDEPAQTVRIRFSAEVAYLIRERRWHPSQKHTVQKDGSIVVTLSSGGMDELATWILSWGPEAVVLEPPVLVELVRSRLTQALRQYS